MAEVLAVLAAVQAATQLLEQSVRVLGRLRRANERQKTLIDVLNRHECELTSVKTIIGIIDDEEELQTANVASELVRLKEVQYKLVKLLEELDPRSKGKANQLAHQFKQGSSDERRLAAIMNELSHVKSALLLRIQVANVGIMRDMEKRLVANAEVIERIDRFLKEEVSDCEGLRIARLLKGRRPSNDGTVPLTPADLKSLRNEYNDVESEDETLVDDSDSNTESTPGDQAKTERIILRNMARHQALQINAAVGKDIWKDINRLEIKDNVAEDQAVQFNYGMTLEVALSLIGGHQGKTKATAPQKAPRSQRRDSGVGS